MRDCTTCMQATSELQRQIFGCGWLPDAPARLRPFVRPVEPLKYQPARDADGQRTVNVCPGYTASLPAVFEIATARLHWEKGHLAEFIEGRPTEDMMTGIVLLEGAYGEIRHAIATPRDKGGIAGD